ncbi:hypothetical protein GOP47_0007425 [Adiantum capillus-veneris]|uniref:Uncharacterized protein n=1 Tax=Adiantum capillus-veneris TaxID=13818 RepID=A0A9D4V1A0_ADICA|nr:hypothetical protein GOP47_0007425 [Adiantum capillus-veneris]
MSTTDRRTGVSRRGMTVLGKVPIAPKPINLPSQRSTFCWGSAGRLQNGGGLPGKFESALLDPVSSDDKFQSKLVTPSGTKNNGGRIDLQEKKVQSSSVTARANSISFGSSTTTASRKMEEPRKSNTCTSFVSGKEEMTDPLLQKGGVSAPPGFPHNGPGNNSRSNVSSTDSQCNGIGNGIHSERSAQDGSQSIPGVPYRSGTKDREIIVIHMVGGPGFYGNYPPQFGSPECYNRNGVLFGNFPLQFGNFEPMFGLQGHGGAHLAPATGSDLFGGHEDFICYEKECYKGFCHDIGRHRNNWVRGSYRENSFLGSVQGEAYDSLISSATSTIKSGPLSQRHLSRNAGRLRSLYRTGRVVSMEETTAEPIAEKRITLLTKVSERDTEAKNTLKEIGGDKDAAETPVGPVWSTYLNQEFYDDEGKPPEDAFQARKVTDEIQVETSLPADVSSNLEMIVDETLPKDSEVESNAVSSKKTCNDNCLHCKGAAVMEAEGSATLVCQACEKNTVCESSFSILQSCLEPTEEVPVMTVEKDSSVDGCKADVKHVILDADNYSTSTIKLEAASKDQKTVMSCRNCSLVSQSGNTEVLEMGSSLSSDAFLTKSAESKQKLVFKKKSQFMWTTKSGLRVSKPHVMSKTLGFQGTQLSLSSISSSDAEESAEVVKGQQEDAVEKSDTSSTCQLSDCKGSNLKMDTSMSFEAPVKRNAQRQLKLVYRKRVAMQAASGPQPSKNSSKTSQPTKAILALPQAELELDNETDEVRSTASASTYKYHIIRRRVYHVVEDSEGDCFLPTAPFSSNDCSKQQQVFKKIVPATAISSDRFDSESISLQESESETKSCSKDTLHTAAPILEASRSPLLPSRQEDNATKKHGKFGKPLSAWKPKVASQAVGSGNSCIGKEKENSSAASAIVEAPDDKKQGSLCSVLVGALNLPKEGNSDEKHSMGTPGELPLESKSSRCGTTQFGEDNQLSDHPDTLLVQEKLLVKLSENAVPEGEAKSGSLKQAGELPPVGLSAGNAEEILAPNEVEQTSNEEITAVYSKHPFVKKKAMSFEKANHFHQILFRRYKEIGQWKPKVNAQKKSYDTSILQMRFGFEGARWQYSRFVFKAFPKRVLFLLQFDEYHLYLHVSPAKYLLYCLFVVIVSCLNERMYVKGFVVDQLELLEMEVDYALEVQHFVKMDSEKAFNRIGWDELLGGLDVPFVTILHRGVDQRGLIAFVRLRI